MKNCTNRKMVFTKFNQKAIKNQMKAKNEEVIKIFNEMLEEKDITLHDNEKKTIEYVAQLLKQINNKI